MANNRTAIPQLLTDVTGGECSVRFRSAPDDIGWAHALFVERIGASLVESRESFVQSATEQTPVWRPRLALAEVGGRRVGAQLGGLLPEVGLLSLPYTAVAAGYEGQGVYTALKRAMLAALERMAGARGLPSPAGNISEEAAGSAQYRRKVERGTAIVLPVPYLQPAAQGVAQTPLALTYEPLTGPIPAFTGEQCLTIVAAVYRALYRIERPEEHSSYQEIVCGLGVAHSGLGEIGGGGL